MAVRAISPHVVGVAKQRGKIDNGLKRFGACRAGRLNRALQ
jgi:hypothetical protein